MERELPRVPRPAGTGLNGSALLGLLAELALADRPATPPSFVEGMGRWLGWKEAIPLSAVLQAPVAVPAASAASAAATSPGAPAAAFGALERDFQRVQAALGRAIDNDSAVAGEDGSSFLPFRRRYFGLQQSMEAAIGPLRAQARAAVARLSPQLAQLAALDAVMADALGPREQAVLAQMPALLDKHFTQLRQAHAGHASSPQDTPWQTTFRQDMRRMLLAERDLRLRPTQGLLDTLRGTPQGFHE
jgi:hypothetical protein